MPSDKAGLSAKFHEEMREAWERELGKFSAGRVISIEFEASNDSPQRYEDEGEFLFLPAKNRFIMFRGLERGGGRTVVNERYHFRVGRYKSDVDENWRITTLKQHPHRFRSSDTSVLTFDTIKSSLYEHSGWLRECLPGLTIAGRWSLNAYLDDPRMVIDSVHFEDDGSRATIEMRNTADWDIDITMTNLRSARVTLSKELGWQISESEATGEFADGTFYFTTSYEYHSVGPIDNYATRIVANATPVEGGSEEPFTLVYERTFEPLDESDIDDRIFYLSHYGFPEPSFAESGSRFGIGMLLIGATMLVGGYLLVRNRRSQTG